MIIACITLALAFGASGAMALREKEKEQYLELPLVCLHFPVSKLKNFLNKNNLNLYRSKIILDL